MPQDPFAQFDLAVLDKIEHSPVGAVPHTPAYQDAVKRLSATHQIYPDADHKDGFVTARSLARLPLFYATNLDDLVAGRIEVAALESDKAIFDRYLQSLPADRRARGEALRVKLVSRPVHHRHKHAGPADGAAVVATVFHDPVHTLFLVPGTGPHPGLPGNYLHGALLQPGPDARTSPWAIDIHDNDDGLARFTVPDLPAALAKLQDVLASAPFDLDELEGLGFVMI